MQRCSTVSNNWRKASLSRKRPLKSSWCKPSPVKAVAGRPVASVAIRRVTDGCEAYTASEQAVRNQPRNWPDCDADAVPLAQGSIRHTVMRGVSGVAGVASPGHAHQGTSREPRRAPYLSRSMGVVTPNPNGTRSLGSEGPPQGKRSRPSRGETCRQGKPEAAATGRGAVLRVRSTDEGGEAQGSRKGRPRYPLEGRDEQVDAPTQHRRHETSNSREPVKWN